MRSWHKSWTSGMVVPGRVKRREGKINDGVKAEDQGCVMWVWHALLALQKRTSLGADKAAHTRTAAQKGWLQTTLL